jgi:predicted GH43/DUF377 family glycosyl hydrolase
MRVFEGNDIVERLAAISGKNIILKTMPHKYPIVAFNAGIAVFGEYAYLYPRIILGYYLYVSAIAEVKISLVDILDGSVRKRKYAAKIAVSPDNRYDIWGAEDPRIYMLDGKLAMTYTGRTKYYFSEKTETEKTYPITAFRTKTPSGNGKSGNEDGVWVKKYVHVLDRDLRRRLVSDKDAYIYIINGETFLFHRPHFIDNNYYTLISKVSPESTEDKLEELESKPWILVAKPASFEIKVGWATPPIKLNERELIVFLHGVDNDVEAYRLFAMHLEFSGDDVVIKAVTPRYIMTPREDYERYGDRPLTIFPCGLWRLNKNEYLISYGAGDYFTGIGLLRLDDLLSELDRGRIY